MACPSPSLFLKSRLIFFEQFKVHSKTVQKVRRVLIYPSALPVDIPHLSDTLVTTNKTTQTHHYHPKSIVYIVFTFGVVHSVGLDNV